MESPWLLLAAGILCAVVYIVLGRIFDAWVDRGRAKWEDEL
jgi:hypothetical protein